MVNKELNIDSNGMNLETEWDTMSEEPMKSQQVWANLMEFNPNFFPCYCVQWLKIMSFTKSKWVIYDTKSYKQKTSIQLHSGEFSLFMFVQINCSF
jgi:hypothetical protein